MSKLKKRNIILSICLISIITFIVFFPTIENDFLRCWDDYIYVVDNTSIHNLSWVNLKEIFSTFLLGNYHPLTLVTYAVEYHFFKLDPRVYHLTNLILHIVNCVLVFFLIFMFTGNLSVAFITGLLFAIHPLRVESVAWISDRKDLLAALFFLCTLLFYLVYRKGESMKYYYCALIMFVLSLLSKAVGITLPLVLLLFDYLQRRTFNKKMLMEKIPFFIIALLFGIIAIFARQSYQEQLLEGVFSFFDKVGIGIHRFIFYYCLRIVAPVTLVHLKPFLANNLGLPFAVFLIGSVIIAILLVVAVIFSIRRTRKIAFGFLFFFITISPVLTVIILGYSADRFSYLPSIGIFFIVAEFCFWLYTKKLKYVSVLKMFFLTICVVAVVLLSFLSWQRCRIWRNCLSLTGYFIKNYPHDPTAYLNRGIVYNDMWQYDKAITDYTTALGINQNYAEAYNRRGNAYASKSEYDNAIADYTGAISENPEYAEAYFNRADIYCSKAEYNKALVDYTQALRIDTTHAELYFNRGNVYARIGFRNEAIDDYTRTLMIDPEHVKALYNRGVTYSVIADYDRAIADYTEALSIDPGYVKVYYNRAVAYFLIKEFEKAWADVRKLTALGYQVDPGFLELLRKALSD